MTWRGRFMPSTPTTRALAAVERHEAALVGRAVHDLDVVVGTRPAGELDLAVVLVAPEPRHRVEQRGRRVPRVGEQAPAAASPIWMAVSQCSTRSRPP